MVHGSDAGADCGCYKADEGNHSGYVGTREGSA